MKPVYFPFTYISDPVIRLMGSCFGQVVIYQPSSQSIPESMRKAVEAGILDIRIPVTGDEEDLKELIKAYRSWVQEHQGSEMSFFKQQKDSIPFFNENSISQIRSDIQKNRQEISKLDPVFNARIFLSIAQEFDLQNWEISRDLVSLDEMEQRLLKELKGEPEEDTELDFGKRVSNIPDDPGIYMTSERLKAWSHLIYQNLKESAFFITTSRAVCDYLLDNFIGYKEIERFDIPVDHEKSDKTKELQIRLIEHFEMLAKKDESGEAFQIPFNNGDSTASLTLWQASYDIFSNFVNPVEKQAGEYKNTLICLVECRIE